MKLLALQLLKGTNQFVGITRVKVFSKRIRALNLKLRLGQHRSIHSFSFRRIKVFGDWIFVAAKNVGILLLVVKRVILIYGIYSIIVDEFVVFPLTFSMPAYRRCQGTGNGQKRKARCEIKHSINKKLLDDMMHIHIYVPCFLLRES